MLNPVRSVASTLFLVLIATVSLDARSVTLTSTDTGTVIGLNGSVGIDGKEYGTALGIGFSIAGVLDLGLTFGADLVPDDQAVTSDIGMTYSVAPLKQSASVPVSAQIYGAWTVRRQTSDFLRRNGLLHEARGYRLGVALMRDLGFGPAVAVRVGALAEYGNYRSTTSVGSGATGTGGDVEVDYSVYPIVELISGFEYGGYVGIMWRPAGGGAFLAGASVLTDSVSLRIRPDLQMLVSR